ncbi:hypothetical protein BJV74DRAFT_890570 [Russula compacta]|nr:hypothetical protein BJV74DRAFT_890570 [Russula compacta]
MLFRNRLGRKDSVTLPAPPPYTPTAQGDSVTISESPSAVSTGRAGGFSMTRDLAPPPPPGADPKLWSSFLAVDVDQSGKISMHELQRALVNGDWTPFDLDTVKLLMDTFDSNRSGDIDFNEFIGLWRYIEDWQKVFRHFDQDSSGTIDSSELQRVLTSYGMKLPQHLLPLLVAKFASSHPGSQVGEQQAITFDRFIRMCVFMKQLTESFTALDKDKDGWVQLNYEQFLKLYFSLP